MPIRPTNPPSRVDDRTRTPGAKPRPQGVKRSEAMADHSLSPTKVQGFFNSIARFLVFTRYTDAAAFRMLLARGRFQSATSVLEVGAGYGCLAEIALREWLAPTAQSTLNDEGKAIVERLQVRFAALAPRVSACLVGLEPPYDFPAGSYDRVMSSYVLDVLNRDAAQKIINEAHRLLTDDGLLCLLLTDRGRTTFSRFVMMAHAILHAIDPRLVGISRPMNIELLLSERDWKIESTDYFHVFGMSSQIVIASKRPSISRGKHEFGNDCRTVVP